MLHRVRRRHLRSRSKVGRRFLEDWQQSRFSNEWRVSGSLASSNRCQSSLEKGLVQRLPLWPVAKTRELSKDLPPDRQASRRSGQRRLSFHCHSERSEESLIFSKNSQDHSQRCFAVLNMTPPFNERLSSNRPAVSEKLSLLDHVSHFRWHHLLPPAVAGL